MPDAGEERGSTGCGKGARAHADGGPSRRSTLPSFFLLLTRKAAALSSLRPTTTKRTTRLRENVTWFLSVMNGSFLPWQAAAGGMIFGGIHPETMSFERLATGCAGASGGAGRGGGVFDVSGRRVLEAVQEEEEYAHGFRKDCQALLLPHGSGAALCASLMIVCLLLFSHVTGKLLIDCLRGWLGCAFVYLRELQTQCLYRCSWMQCCGCVWRGVVWPC